MYREFVVPESAMMMRLLPLRMLKKLEDVLGGGMASMFRGGLCRNLRSARRE